MTADDAGGGLHIVDWGTRRRFPGDGYPPADNGGAADGLVTQFRGFGHHPVTARCGQSKVSDELDISAATTSSRGTMKGLVITYRPRGATRTMHTPYELAQCTGKICPEQKYS